MLHFASNNIAQVKTVKDRFSKLNESYIDRATEANNPLINKLIVEYDNGFTSRKIKNNKSLNKKTPLCSLNSSRLKEFILIIRSSDELDSSLDVSFPSDLI